MCLVVFAYRTHPEQPLVLLANRDEFHDRASRAAAFWPENPHIYAGRDMVAGGAWLGASRGGRIAAVTNFRDGMPQRIWPRSRGELVSGFLAGDAGAGSYLENLHPIAAEYAPFNLLLMDGSGLWHFSNRTLQVTEVPPGVHGLSNHLLNTAWPKVTRGCEALTARLQDTDDDRLLMVFGDRTPVADAELPTTGVDVAWERRLAPIFIKGQRYDTRGTSLIRCHRDGRMRFIERRFGPNGALLGETRRNFAVSCPPAA